MIHRLVFRLLLPAFTASLFPVCLNAQQTAADKFVINTSIFDDAAHHWYDLADKHKLIQPLPGKPRYQPSELIPIGDNILLFQKNNGGWPKNYDIFAKLTPAQMDTVQAAKAILNTTFDNRTTYSHIAALAGIYTATGEERFKAGALKGIEYVLEAQYDNGGWPQYYPLEKGYSRHITFNDDAFAGIMEFLRDIFEEKPIYRFVDADLRKRVKTAFDKGLDCILNTQIRENGTLTAWCQQHDEVTLAPTWARKFEPPSICNAESVKIVQLLMSIKTPSPAIINAVNSAVAWFKASAITGIRVETIKAKPESTPYMISRTDKIVVQDSTAPVIWTRYYELQTHRPLFCNRDSKVVYSLAEVERERRTGYAWYTYGPQKVLDKYPGWSQKHHL